MSDDPLLAALIGLRNRLEAVAGEFREELRDELTKLRIEMMGRFEKVENRLTVIQDDIAVNMGGISTVFDQQAGMR